MLYGDMIFNGLNYGIKIMVAILGAVIVFQILKTVIKSFTFAAVFGTVALAIFAIAAIALLPDFANDAKNKLTTDSGDTPALVQYPNAGAGTPTVVATTKG